MTTKTKIIVILVFLTGNIFGQSKELYQDAFDKIINMLKGEIMLDFKKAVFITENVFYSNKLDYVQFCKQIDSIEYQLNKFMIDKNVINHPMGKQFAIFSYMIEPSKYNDNTKLRYDFEDLTGQKDWSKMFVTKLLNTKTGNCHSLPYLYKILSEELKGTSYLALGPNHMYIKHKDNKSQWVNVELTNGSFPRDGWIIASLSITTDAIKNEVYMEPLSLKESVAFCLYDLAIGYQFHFGYDDFGIKCSNAILEYFPTCIYAYMLESEVYADKRRILLDDTNSKPQILEYENKINEIYKKIDEMGYKEMPKKQYEQWLRDVENEKIEK